MKGKIASLLKGIIVSVETVPTMAKPLTVHYKAVTTIYV